MLGPLDATILGLPGDPDRIVVSGRCRFTGDSYVTAPMLTVDLDAWAEGEDIREVLGYLSPDDREFLMSGISPAGLLV